MQRERLYRTLAENSPFAIRRLDNEFKFIYSNKGSSVSELSKEDFVGKTIDEIGMNEDIVKSWKRCGQKVFTTGENQEIVNEIPLSNGFITFKSTIVPEFDIKDEIESILVITEDITEFKKTENELKISKENFRTLAENSPDTIIRLDKDMKYAYVNPVITENSGKPPEYYIGKRYDEVGIPEKYVKIFEENNRKAIENGEIQRYEFEFPTIKGMKYIESIAIPEFNANEEIESLLILDRDITERKNFEDSLKESRAQLRIAMDLAKLVSWQYDVESDLFTFDNHFYALYGTSAEREGGTLLSSEKYARKFIPPEEVSIVKEEIDRAIKTDNPNFVENMEHSIIRADGEKRYINVRFGVIKDKNGKTIKTFGSNQDITSLKETEEQLKETIKELERSNEELQQFAYVSSHDLQEPLRTIASFTQLLERRYKGKLDSDADEFMDYIVEASVRMKAQIEGLLEYSRVGTKGEEFKPADMNEILNKTIQSLNTSIKEIDTNIKVDELPVVMGDGNQLQRVFQNLISNAIKFKKQEEPLKIHVYANKDICNNEYVFSVQDNGIGIEEQYNERIFTIFQRLHTRDVYEGTGIGLSVVKRIIERHGGRVWVESSFGKGSTFYFTIPISGSEF
ncbi:PAS domain-containing sensor histidine kinase [Methanobacterium sp.]